MVVALLERTCTKRTTLLRFCCETISRNNGTLSSACGAVLWWKIIAAERSALASMKSADGVGFLSHFD